MDSYSRNESLSPLSTRSPTSEKPECYREACRPSADREECL